MCCLCTHILVKPYNIIQENKLTPLHWAAAEGHTKVVSLLIEKGANVNMKDNVS